MIAALLTRLQHTGWSRALADSHYVWPFTEAAHVLLLALFLGTVVMMDLRLVGVAFRDVPVSAFTRRLLPWTRWGFAGMAITGVVLFLATPADYAANPFFRAKIVLLLLAGANAWAFHRGAHRSVERWDTDPHPPTAARVAGVASLVLWALVVAAGRRIPYEDRWTFPLLEAAHLTSLCVLAGSLLVVDLRMLDLGLTGRTVPDLERQARPWLFGGLAAAATTGALLLWFASRNVWVVPAFWLKMSILPVAVAWTFTVRARVAQAQDGTPEAGKRRRTAIVSAFLWLAVASAGRWIGWS